MDGDDREEETPVVRLPRKDVGDLIITRDNYDLWSENKIIEWRHHNPDRWVRMILDGYYEKLPIPQKPSHQKMMILDVLIVNGTVLKHRGGRRTSKSSSNLV